MIGPNSLLSWNTLSRINIFSSSIRVGITSSYFMMLFPIMVMLSLSFAINYGEVLPGMNATLRIILTEAVVE